VIVRQAGAADIAELSRLRWEWRASDGRPLEMSQSDFSAAFARWATDHATTHLAFVAEHVDETVGMAWLALVERVPGPDRWVRESGSVQSVYVTPAHRGCGIGTKLVEAVMSEARDRGLSYLIVHPSELSFPLYRRLGFREWRGVLELDVAAERMNPSDE
jgi:GNAT superfamily N-acetyltransferase